jgi:hypothetical protein
LVAAERRRRYERKLLRDGFHENAERKICGESNEDILLAEAHAFRADAKTLNLLSLCEQRLQRAVLKNLLAPETAQKALHYLRPAPAL